MSIYDHPLKPEESGPEKLARELRQLFREHQVHVHLDGDTGYRLSSPQWNDSEDWDFDDMLEGYEDQSYTPREDFW